MRDSDSPARAFVCSTVSFWNAKRVAWSLRGLASMSRSRACGGRAARQRQRAATGDAQAELRSRGFAPRKSAARRRSSLCRRPGPPAWSPPRTRCPPCSASAWRRLRTTAPGAGRERQPQPGFGPLSRAARRARPLRARRAAARSAAAGRSRVRRRTRTALRRSSPAEARTTIALQATARGAAGLAATRTPAKLLVLRAMAIVSLRSVRVFRVVPPFRSLGPSLPLTSADGGRCRACL